MDNDELQEGQTGTLKKPYLGYRHVEFVEYDYPRVRVQLSSGLEISVPVCPSCNSSLSIAFNFNFIIQKRPYLPLSEQSRQELIKCRNPYLGGTIGKSTPEHSVRFFE